ncbi:MAG: M56 family metallopeptidase [Oculatellaceae cyanobacterium Prado106]|jgi:Zn-dependent protease with chaperone function|nr:M56 family metallopeptidase [Oculatellaceae cyanobacterium Prado106]
MHLSLILFALAIALLLRFGLSPVVGDWGDRWQQAVGRFLLPPLLLLTTLVAVLSMGTHGQMLGLPVGWIGCLLALSFLVYALVRLLVLVVKGWRSHHRIQTYARVQIQQHTIYRLDSPLLFAAQVGLWQPQLVVSQGLLDALTDDQIEAVLTHEEAHRHYHDTFWFFWLGWLRQMTPWLPATEALWQELLLLRELRADQWAAQRVDPLLLAESLLLVVKTPFASDLNSDPGYCAAFGTATPENRLEERIESLLTDPQQSCESRISILGLAIALIPLFTLLLHH